MIFPLLLSSVSMCNFLNYIFKIVVNMGHTCTASVVTEQCRHMSVSIALDLWSLNVMLLCS